MRTDNRVSFRQPGTQPINRIPWDRTENHEANHFDSQPDRLGVIVRQLILNRGVFHLAIHFSGSQLVCWTFDNPYSYQIYHAEEIFSDNFMRLFAPLDSHLNTCIPRDQVESIIDKLIALRCRKHGSELRNASIHILNGLIALSFACDDTRYIDFRDFVRPLF